MMRWAPVGVPPAPQAQNDPTRCPRRATSTSVGCLDAVPLDGQVTAADSACCSPCGVLIRRCDDGIGAADRGRCVIQVDLGAAHGQERFVLFVPQLEQPHQATADTEVATADAVACARPVPKIKPEGRAVLIYNRGDGAARHRVEECLPAGVNDDLVVAVLLGVDQQRGALKGAGAVYLCLAIALRGSDSDDGVGDP